jgi:putative ABC transport system permease protein
MNNVFGLPMSTLLVGLLIVLAILLATVVFSAMRNPVIFKLGVRNIPRRKAQTILIVVGLMLSTLIISAALGTGDTLHYSLTKDSYQTLDEVDQLIVPSHEFVAPNADTSTTFSAATVDTVDRALANNDDVDGIIPILDARVSAVDATSQQSEPTLVLTGVDPGQLFQFGGLRSADGKAIDLAALPANSVVLSAKASEDLDAAVGDTVTVFYNDTPHALVVGGIARNSYLSGYRRGREDYLEYGGMVMPLAAVQELTGQADQISAIALSGRGNARSGYRSTDAVIASLRTPLAGTGLGVDAIKRYSVEDGERIALNFTNIFLILGLFSILSGLLLITLIFTMLAAERRPEMGMARAVGTRRMQLVQQFIAEGAGYALLAGLLGSFLGVLASIGIARAMKLLFGQYVPISPHVEPRSMVVAYCLGVIITLLTVIISSWRISRLNVVAAIRNIPDVTPAHRSIRTLLAGLALTVLGGALAGLGLSGGNAFLFFLGASLLPLGLAQIARFLGVPGRPVLSLVGVALLALWLLPNKTVEAIVGDLDGGIEMFFLAGVFLVIGATVLIVQNTDVLLRGLNRVGGVFKSTIPAVRTAVAYPSAARGRTGMTIAMFSLIIFSLVMMATMNANVGGSDDASAGWDVIATSPGNGTTGNVTDELSANGVDTSDFAAVGVVTNPAIFSSEMKLPAGDQWKLWPVFGVDDGFLTNGTLRFQQRAAGYANDDAILTALQTQPNVAVIDSWVVPSGDLGGNGDSSFALTGFSTGDDDFTPITVDLVAQDGSIGTVTIIGIIDDEISSLHGLYTNQKTVDRYYPQVHSTSYMIALGDPTRANAVAHQIEAAMLANGTQADSVRDQIRDAEKENSGFLYLVEGFMGLGLIVGVAAVGVIAFRSVVERRQQIGVLRALGFPRSLVSLGFMIETTFMVGLGVISGTALGVLLAHNMLTSDSFGDPVSSFTIPWMMIVLLAIGTPIAGLLLTWLPSRQAARIAPAAALRYE